MQDQASGSGAGGNGTSSYADSLTWTREAGAALAATGLQATPTPSHGPGERERRWRQRDFKLRRLPHMDQASGSGGTSSYAELPYMDQASGSGAGGNGTSSYADSLTWTREAGAALAATGLQATPTPSHGPGERERRWRQRDFKLRRLPHMDQGSGSSGTSSYAELPYMDQGSESGAGGNGTSSYAGLPDMVSGSGAGGNGTSSYAELPYMDDREREQTALAAATRERLMRCLLRYLLRNLLRYLVMRYCYILLAAVAGTRTVSPRSHVGFAGVAVVVAAGLPSQSSAFECDESQTASICLPFRQHMPPFPPAYTSPHCVMRAVPRNGESLGAAEQGAPPPGRTLVLPRVRSSRISGNNLPLPSQLTSSHAPLPSALHHIHLPLTPSRASLPLPFLITFPPHFAPRRTDTPQHPSPPLGLSSLSAYSLLVPLSGLFPSQARSCCAKNLLPETRCVGGVVLDAGDSLSSIAVITGRGKHSASGQARIKPPVHWYLQERRVGWQEQNTGIITGPICR
ncbi:unnamed protein product [Closterium sp. Yama58-4]|nr:unnamed protein product [Closterium sp. Yama58-4]